MAASMVCLMHLVKAGVTKTIYSRVPLHARDANIPVSQSRGFETLTNVKIYLSHHTNIFFILCTCLLKRNRSLFRLLLSRSGEGWWAHFHFRPQTSVHKLPSTNFRPQTSVHKFLSTSFRRHLVPHDTHSLLACARMNELKKDKIQ